MLSGTKGFLTIWHGLDPSGRKEWEKWHTIEHMPERVGIPGFLAGRRYMNEDKEGQCCFTLYEATNISIFKSEAYLERLNNPTPWTQEVAHAFRNFTRGACRRIATAGSKKNYGGAALTFRLLKNENFREDEQTIDNLQKTADKISQINIVTNINIGLSDPEVTKTETKERTLRKSTNETSLDGVFVIEGYDPDLLQAEINTIEKIVLDSKLSLSTEPAQIHKLAYVLLKEE